MDCKSGILFFGCAILPLLMPMGAVAALEPDLHFDLESPTLSADGKLRPWGDVKQVDGVLGHALHFGGNSSGRGELNINAGGALSPLEGSIALWVKPDFDFEIMDGGWDFSLVESDAMRRKDGRLAPHLGFNPREGCIYAGFSNSKQIEARVYGWDPRFNRQTWNHLCMTWRKGGSLKLYVNGSLEGRFSTEAFNIDAETLAQDLVLGPGIGIGPGVSLDEFSLFGKELAEPQVRELAEAGAPFLLDYPSSLKDRLLFRGEKATASFESRRSEPLKALSELVSTDGSVLWSAPIELKKGLNAVGFESSGVAPTPTGMCYARLRTGDGFSQAFPLVICPPSSAKSSSDEIRVELASIDFTASMDGNPNFKQGVPSTVKESPLGKYRESEGLFAWRFNVKNAKRPHILIVEYPDDALRTMAFDINDGSARSPQGAGVVTGFPGANTMLMKRQEMIFWPDTVNCALIVYNWASPRGKAAAAKATVYEIENDFKAIDVVEPSEGRTRQIGTQVEDASASGFWGGFGEGLGRWNTTIDHMVSYMRRTGQNTYEYPMMWYDGPLFRSPYNDSFGPGTGVRAHHPDGSYRVILRKFEAAGLKLYPELYFRNLCSLDFPSRVKGDKFKLTDAQLEGHFSAPAPFDQDMRQVNLNGKRRVEWNGQMVEDGPGRGPIYNPLHPTVQKALFSLIDDFLAAAGPSKAFGGFKLDFTSWGGTPSLESLNNERLLSDYSDFTVGLFSKETGVAIPGDTQDPARFKLRHAFLTAPEMRERWISWRCGKIHSVLMEIAKKVWAYNPEAEIVVGVACAEGVGPKSLGFKTSFIEASRECGIDPALFTDRRMRFEIWDGIASEDNVWACRGFNLKRSLLNNDPDFDKGFVDKGPCSFVQWLSYWEIFEPVYKDLWPEVRPNVAPVRQITPAGPAFLKIWAERLAISDLKRLFMGGMGCSPMQGHEKELVPFVKAFRHLPDIDFATLPSKSKTVVARSAQSSKKGYCYFVNRESCEVDVNAYFSGLGSVFDPVAAKDLKLESGKLSLKLPPYGLASFSFDKSGALDSFDVKVDDQDMRRVQTDFNAFGALDMDPAGKEEADGILASIKAAIGRGDLYDAHCNLNRLKYLLEDRKTIIAMSKLPCFKWQLIGPFSGSDKASLATVFQPEMAFVSGGRDIPKCCQDNGDTLTLHESSSTCLDYKGKFQPGLIKLDSQGTFYGFMRLEADSDTTCVLAAGIDDWGLVRINGSEVLSVTGPCMGIIPEEHQAKVALKKGINEIGIKLVNGGGPGGFCMTFKDDAGNWPSSLHCMP